MLLDLSLSPGGRLVALTICCLLFLLLLYLAFRHLGRYRLIADTPTALIRSAPQGYVEIIGQVIAGEDGMLRSPLSERPCVWYRVRVDQYQSGSNNKASRWRPVLRDSSSSWFQINDGTGHLSGGSGRCQCQHPLPQSLVWPDGAARRLCQQRLLQPLRLPHSG